MHKVYKIKIVKRVRRNLNRRGIYTQLARKAAHNNRWGQAKVYYLKVQNLIEQDTRQIELRNEIKLNVSTIDRLLSIDKYKNEIEKYNQIDKKRRIAVVVAISGGYDTIKLPAKLNPDVDYILFTDTASRSSGIFKVRPLPYYHVDKTRMARFVKTNLHNLLPEYDVAIWVDANIQLLSDLGRLIDGFVSSKKPIGAIPHPLRNSVYSEGEACIKQSKDDASLIRMQLERLKNLKYKNNDLIESGFMMFDLKHPNIKGFFDTWWAEIDKYSRRDQISLNYAIDTNKLSWYRLMERPFDARTYPEFALVPHHIKQPAVYALENKLNSKQVYPYKKGGFSENKMELLRSELSRKVDIVYCVHNALDDVKLCLASVVKYRVNPNLKLIIIDDGSDLKTKKFLEKFQKAHSSWTELHRKETGSGYTKAANRGLMASKGDFVILLNSDTIVTENWSEKMTHAAYSMPSIGIVGPLSSAASHQSIPNHKSKDKQTAINELPTGVTPDILNKKCESWSAAGLYPLVPLIHGFCFGIKREVIKSIGLFSEENFPNGYGEENDYCFRATDAGYRLTIATNTYIYHAKSKSYLSEDRIINMKNGSEALQRLHTKERITRSVAAMEKNPLLALIREKAEIFYKTKTSA